MRNIAATITAFFVFIMVISGILLNHASDLKLDQKHLTWHWLLKHYDLVSVQADTVYILGKNVVSQFGNDIFIGATPSIQSDQLVVGGIALEEIMVVATENSLLLFNLDGDFIDQMGLEENIPADIQNIGLFHGDPVIQTRTGLWRSDLMLAKWENVSLQGVGWSSAQPMPDSIEIQLAEYFHGRGVTVEKILLDIHNGHILPKYGIWILDILGFLLIWLMLTGSWNRERF